MGTYAELRARVAAELNRTDQTANIISAIDRAIAAYADQRFWFNQTHATATLDAGETYLVAPRRLDDLFVLDGTTRYRLDEVTQSEMEDLHAGTASAGLPYLYAEYGSTVRVYPEPDQTYTFDSWGVFDVTPALSSDAASNAWTSEAQDLIAARAKLMISRDIIGNVDRAGKPPSRQGRAGSSRPAKPWLTRH
jgi:hypothetical protein